MCTPHTAAAACRARAVFAVELRVLQAALAQVYSAVLGPRARGYRLERRGALEVPVKRADRQREHSGSMRHDDASEVMTRTYRAVTRTWRRARRMPPKCTCNTSHNSVRGAHAPPLLKFASAHVAGQPFARAGRGGLVSPTRRLGRLTRPPARHRSARRPLGSHLPPAEPVLFVARRRRPAPVGAWRRRPRPHGPRTVDMAGYPAATWPALHALLGKPVNERAAFI
jgi:hypothetical protein